MSFLGGRVSGTGRTGRDADADPAAGSSGNERAGSDTAAVSDGTDSALGTAADSGTETTADSGTDTADSAARATDRRRSAGGRLGDDAPLFDLGTALGGRRGIIDASLPGFVLVVVNVAASIWWAVLGAVVTSVLIGIVRIIRREPLRQAVSGVFGIALAALLAAYTGKAKNFFLPGILINGGYVVALLASVAVRRPALGYVAAALDRRFAHWRSDRGLVRRADYATLVWTAVFAVRFVLQGWLYLHDHVGWLATARLALGWPLWGLAVMLSLLLLQPSDAGQPSSRFGRSEGAAPSRG
jgi:hypothetical protein